MYCSDSCRFLAEEQITTGISLTDTTIDSDSLETTSNILTINNINDGMTGSQYKCVADLSDIDVPDTTLISPHKAFNLSIQCKYLWFLFLYSQSPF